MNPIRKRKSFDSFEEAPPFVREQLVEYIFWMKKLGVIQAYISYRQKKSEEKMEWMHANYNDMIIQKSYEIEDEIQSMGEMIARQLKCVHKDELQRVLSACLEEENEEIEEIKKNFNKNITF